jgi:uncharacterized zinc-type alcohol dehydrogenase-like protein
MLEVRGYAAHSSKESLKPFSFKRRDLQPNDVQIEISHCGICHSDIHQVRDEWGGSIYPMVPGHEIVGKVTKVGTKVTALKVGDLAGVGCFVDSCRHCPSCEKGLEQYCENGFRATYNSLEADQKTPTFGGYSTAIVVDEKYTLRIPPGLDLSAVAPLLCAGITTYSPLRHAGVSRGHRVGIVGLGGLGHMGVKFAAAFGAEVAVLSTSKSKEADAKKLGAHHFVNTRDEKQLAGLTKHFDFILNTVSAPLNLGTYLELLKTDGTFICVGAPDRPLELPVFPLILKRRKIMGSLIGGIKETQEMLDFCGKNKIVSEIELITAPKINEAYERMLKSDVRYRFVIDAKSF